MDITLSRSLLLVQPIGNGGSGGLVNYSKHIHARNYSSILGSLALGVVEVSRHSNDRILNLRAQVRFRGLLHLGKDHGRDLLRGELLGLVLVLHLQLGLGGIVNYSEGPVFHIGLDGGILELSSNQALGIKDCVGGVDRHLVLGGVSYQPLGVSEGHVRGGGPITLVISNNFNLPVLEHTHTRVGGPQVNTNSSLFSSHLGQLLVEIKLKEDSSLVEVNQANISL